LEISGCKLQDLKLDEPTAVTGFPFIPAQIRPD